MTGDTPRILVVDDDSEVRERLTDFFSKHGLEIHTVPNGAAMDKALSEQTFDLLVLDVMMPGEGGLSIANRLKQSSTLPIIMLTGLIDDVDRIVGLEIGADDYVVKPFNPRVLLARIRAVLRRQTSLLEEQVITAGNLLIVEAEGENRKCMVAYLEQQGFDITIADSSAGVEAELNRRVFDLLILDLDLPGENGLQIATHLRRETELPIIMKTATRDEIDQVVGLELGADDFIDRHPSPRELSARIKAVLRRNSSRNTVRMSDGTYRFGNFILDSQHLSLSRENGETIALTSGEFELLQVLVQHPWQTLNRDRIMELLSEESKSRVDRSIDVRITRLRSKIETNPSEPEFIKTVWGKGYVFCPE